MDTRPETIKMFGKAVEITAGHKWEDGDVFVWLENIHQDTVVHNWWIDKGTIDFYREGSWESSEFITPTNALWLPRQDQLQEMVFGVGRYSARQITKALWDACKEHGSLVPREELGIPRIGTVDKKWSMEQLWLGFVMNSLYQKSWNGQEWIKCV